MQRIDGKDAIFLYMETPTYHMHMAFAGVFDPSTIPGGIESPRDIFVKCRQLIEKRLHLFPPFRQKLVFPPFDLAHPMFVDDPHFDLDFHLHRGALPAPGGRRELEEFVGRVLSRPLDRAHPLWEWHIVEGVEGGRWAMVAKAHHVIIDGVGGNEMMIQLMDLTAEPREVPPPASEFKGEKTPSDSRMLLDAVVENIKRPPQFVRQVAKSAGTVTRVLREKMGADDEAALATLGPRTILNDPVTPRRSVGFGKFPLEDVKRIKGAFDCTVNDVVLAICGRALRAYLADNGQHPDRSLVVSVPISVRKGDEETLGNRVAGMTVPMADEEDDLHRQIARIREVTKTAKDRLGAITADLMTDWTHFATPALAARAFRFYAESGLQSRHRPVANVTISNVPGPPFPIYIAGSKMDSMYPLGPVVLGQAVNITVVSYLGTMFVGVVGCPDTTPDIARVITHIDTALADFLAETAAIEARAATPKKATPKKATPKKKAAAKKAAPKKKAASAS